MVGLVTDSVEVTWLLDDITMRGTLTVPAGDGRFPAVVMVAGSGPTDRDWCSPLLPGTNGSARLLAEAFADAGIASLRYDKRASGPDVAESARILCSYGVNLEADEAIIGRCKEYIWTRLNYGSQKVDLLFKAA